MGACYSWLQCNNHGKGAHYKNANDAILAAYNESLTDEFIPPSVIGDFKGVKDGDGLLCMNYRADRAREIMAAIGEPSFNKFDVGIRPKLSILSGFAEYSDQPQCLHGLYLSK